MLRILTTLALAIASTEAVNFLSTDDANTILTYTAMDEFTELYNDATDGAGGR